MKNRVLESLLLALTTQDFVHIDVVQALGNLLDQPAQLSAQVRAGDVLKKLPQKRVRFANQVRRFFKTERLAFHAVRQRLHHAAKHCRVLEDASSEQPIGGCLGVHVRELFGLQIGHEQGAK